MLKTKSEAKEHNAWISRTAMVSLEPHFLEGELSDRRSDNSERHCDWLPPQH